MRKHYVMCEDSCEGYTFEDIVAEYSSEEEALEAVEEMNALGMDVYYKDFEDRR